MEMSPTQLELSVNMFDNMEDGLQQFDDHSGNQDDQYSQDVQERNMTNQNDQDNRKLEWVAETAVTEMSPTQLESSMNTSNDTSQQLDDQNSNQDDQDLTTDQQENKTTDEYYEVQGASVTFDSDSEDDDYEHVTVQVEEASVITSEEWLHSTNQPSSTESVSVTIATTEYTPNCVTVTPLL